MRIIATSDLHYNIARSRVPTEQIAHRICRSGGDILLLLGDMCGMDLSYLSRVFELFDAFPGVRAYVPGNHEMWTPPNDDTMIRYSEEIPALCKAHDVHFLDDRPLLADDIAIVGNVGWYDYSFRAEQLGIPLRFYENKAAPGTAALRPNLRHLIEQSEDISPASMSIVCRWMDGEHVRLPMSDGEFVEKTAERLAHQLEAVESAEHVIVGMHHLPFFELVPTHVTRRPLMFAGAYLGSGEYGKVIARFANVRHVLCGHSHAYAKHQRGGLTATAIGSTYTEKRFETIDL